MIPTVFASTYLMFPPRMMAQLSVVIGLTATMAPTIGPSLGGWITQHLSWEWLFLINVLPGAAVASAVFAFVRIDRPRPELLKGFDLAGILLVAVFLGTLQYVLEEGPGDDWFESGRIAALAAVCAVAGALFFWRELTVANPVIELKAFHDRNFAIGCLYSFIIGIGLYGSVYLLPLYLGRIRGYDSLEIGVTMMVTGAFQLLSAPLAGALARKIDLRLMLAAGLALFGTGLWLNSYMTAEWGYWELFLPQAVRGLSLMLCFLPINTIALGTLPAHEVQNASGLYNLMRNLGGAIGLAAINTVLSMRYDLHHTRIAESLTAARGAGSAMLEGLAARLEPVMGAASDAAALKLLTQLAAREASVMTFDDALMLMAAAFAFALLFMPLVRKVSAEGEAAAH
jgi:DHA2 family multidrug resistance protein